MGLPGGAARNARSVPSCQLNVHLKEKLLRAVPAVSEHHAHRIRATFEIGRDVVGGVEHAFLIGRPSRVEHVVTHFAAVDPQLVVTQAADIGPRADRAFGKLKLAAELIGPANPLPFPLLAIEQAHLKLRSLAILALPALLVPVAHFPVVRAPALEGLAGVSHLRRLARFDLAAVPLVALVVVERLAASRHEHLVSRLRLAALGVLEHPGKARLSHIHAQRV